MIEKAPGTREIDDGMGNKQKVRSPNIGDSIGMLYFKYFENGLRAHGSDITDKKEEATFTMPTMTM